MILIVLMVEQFSTAPSTRAHRQTVESVRTPRPLILRSSSDLSILHSETWLSNRAVKVLVSQG